jgi:hypothetical protein
LKNEKKMLGVENVSQSNVFAYNFRLVNIQRLKVLECTLHLVFFISNGWI